MSASLYRHALERAILPAGDRLAGSTVMRHYHAWRSLQWADAEALRTAQRERLARVLTVARTRVPFYRALGAALDVSPGGDPHEALRRVPVLRKAMFKDRVDEFLSAGRAGLVANVSSGSSGVQSTVYADRDEQSVPMAIQLLWMTWSGWRPGDTVFQTGITPSRGLVKGAKDRLLRTWYVNAFRTSEAGMVAHLRALERHPRALLAGYASSLYLYAQTALAHGIRVDFRHAVSWGDKLFAHYRGAVERAFGSRVTDTYGCTEGCMIAAQCEAGAYHIMSPHVVLELLDDEGREVAPGAMGHVVVTRLDAFRMPLIRYALGDLAARRPEGERCSCGRALPLLDRIVGRDTDIVRTAGGRFLNVHFFTGIFEFVPEVRQFQVVQDRLDGITVRYVPEPACDTAVLEGVRARIARELEGEPFAVTFETADAIAPSPSGKPQIVRSTLPRAVPSV